MELSILTQWAVFGILAAISVAGALGMTTTMSMFRSGIFLMASFVGVAGLFLALGADLLGLLQVMMYVGGMLVMILFMVLFSTDPGGAMMTRHMSLPLVEKLFSLGLGQPGGGEESERAEAGDNGHEQPEQGGHEQGRAGEGGAGGSEGHVEHQGHGDMSMFTPLKKPAALLGAASATLLSALLLGSAPWPRSSVAPDPDSARRIGELLMGKYMIAFEGAGMLILLGIFGAVYLQRPERHPDPTSRSELRAALDEAPPSIGRERLEALAPAPAERKQAAE